MIFTLHKVDDTFVLNKFGIKETDNEEISVNDIELFICPCLAYNKSGNRLGYGGGYYDKALSSSGAKKMELLSNYKNYHLIVSLMIFQWTTFVMKTDYLPADKSPFLNKVYNTFGKNLRIFHCSKMPLLG